MHIRNQMHIQNQRHLRRNLATLIALTLGATACGQDDAGDPQASAQVEALRFSQGGSACMGDCSRSFGVVAPNLLVLEDAEGRIELTIAQEDVSALLALGQTADFAQAIEQVQAGEGCNGADIHIDLSYQRQGEAEQGPLGVNGCAAQQGHPMAEAFTHLQALMEANLQCPTWQQPEGFEMATDPLPQRALCYFCYGRCQSL
jgi:hypothetical protein